MPTPRWDTRETKDIRLAQCLRKDGVPIPWRMCAACIPKCGDRMKLTLPRFGLRALLSSIAVVACLLAVAVRAQRIHDAARFVESHGGDVWCGELQYTGSDFGREPYSTARILWLRSTMVTQIMLGTKADLWICYVPDDRQRFAQALEVLNPQEIRFDVLGPIDFAWVRACRPATSIYPAPVPDRNDLESVPDATPAEESATVVDSDQEPVRRRFDDGVAYLDRLRSENPRLFYRLDRYEVIFVYPDHGELGHRYDHFTGRGIELPWPH